MNDIVNLSYDIKVNAQSKDVLLPQEYYSKGDYAVPIEVFYISDIHLTEHISNAGIDVDNRELIDGFVDKIVDKLIRGKEATLTDGGVSSTDERELLFTNYGLFRIINRNLSEKELKELDRKICKDEIKLVAPQYLYKCLCVLGDLGSDIEIVTLFFERLTSKLREYYSLKNKNYENTEDDDVDEAIMYELGLCYESGGVCPIIFVLGNHELSAYETIEDAVIEYKKALTKFGVTVLQNKVLEFENCTLLGGTGFAKYNEQYNADTLIGPAELKKNRSAEAKESDKLVTVYEKVLESNKNKPVIVLSHYPITDWLGKSIDDAGYFFYGHNHQNDLLINEKYRIYADNQVGYTDYNMRLKSVLLGTCYNPFVSYKDGYYEVSAEKYQAFCNYSGKYVSIRTIQKQIERGDKLYMIKRNGFYAFFLVSKSKTKICYGGRQKVVSKCTNIAYYYEIFEIMLATYFEIMLPLRKAQEELAQEVKRLNIMSPVAGNIHGTIVDVDFYHHIMINPFDGKITFYYSPMYGMIQEFGTFQELLESYCKKEGISDERKKIDKELRSLSAEGIRLKCKGRSTIIDSNEIQKISIKDSLYSVSNKIGQLQRLFTANILRDWNDDLAKELLKDNSIEIETVVYKPLCYGEVKKKSNEPRPVAQIDPISGVTIRTFPSIQQASIEVGINTKSIRSVLNGQQKTAAGYYWVLMSE